MRRQLPLRPARPPIPRPADVVFGREPRICEPRGHGRAFRPGEPATAAGLPVPASREDRAVRDDLREHRTGVRDEGPRALQRGRLAGHRGRPEAGAQEYGAPAHARLPGRLPRPHPRGIRDHFVLPLPRGVRRIRGPRRVPALSLHVSLAIPGRCAEDRGLLRTRIRAPVRARVHGRLEPEDRPFGVRRVLRRGGPGHRAAT